MITLHGTLHQSIKTHSQNNDLSTMHKFAIKNRGIINVLYSNACKLCVVYAFTTEPSK